MSHSYPSDISREQFAWILPTLESARRRTKPRTVDLYDVFCGVLYRKAAASPRLPQLARYFRQWSERPDPEHILEQVGAARQSNGLLHRGLPERQEHGQRRAEGLAVRDKRHIGTRRGCLMRHITTANVTDRAGALARTSTGTVPVKCGTCWWMGVDTGKSLLLTVQGTVEVVKRSAAHLRSLPAMGGGAVFRLAGKVPTTQEPESSIPEMVALAFTALITGS